MSLEQVAVLLGAAIGFFAVFLVVHKKRPKKLKVERYNQKWKELQQFCKDKATWPEAIFAADALLDEALKRRRFKGKSMGERMVAAQRKFSDNDLVWYAHNYCKKIREQPTKRLKKADVQEALMGFRQALKDIGALGNDQPGKRR